MKCLFIIYTLHYIIIEFIHLIQVNVEINNQKLNKYWSLWYLKHLITLKKYTLKNAGLF